MSANVFIDKLAKPDNQALVRALGKTFPLWVEIENHVATAHAGSIQDWKYYGPKSGWTLKTPLRKRNLFFFTPYQGYFRIAFIFGGRAVAEILTSDLPKTLIKEVENAKKYAEGKGLRVEVKTRRDVESVKKLIAIKVMN